MVCEFEEPTVTLPRLALVGVMARPACNPVPETGITVLAPSELVTVMFPLTVSEVDGLNLTVSDVACPGVSVVGNVKPLVVTSFALTLSCEIVTLLLPLFVSVTVFEFDVPAFTLPKLTLVGLADIVTDAATPVPLRETVLGEFGALLTIFIVPLRLPAVVGAKVALKVVLCPAARDAGVVKPLALYAAPLIVICEMVREAVPELVTVKLCDLVCPSTILPKL